MGVYKPLSFIGGPTIFVPFLLNCTHTRLFAVRLILLLTNGHLHRHGAPYYAAVSLDVRRGAAEGPFGLGGTKAAVQGAFLFLFESVREVDLHTAGVWATEIARVDTRAWGCPPDCIRASVESKDSRSWSFGKGPGPGLRLKKYSNSPGGRFQLVLSFKCQVHPTASHSIQKTLHLL